MIPLEDLIDNFSKIKLWIGELQILKFSLKDSQNILFHNFCIEIVEKTIHKMLDIWIFFLVYDKIRRKNTALFSDQLNEYWKPKMGLIVESAPFLHPSWSILKRNPRAGKKKK